MPRAPLGELELLDAIKLIFDLMIVFVEDHYVHSCRALGGECIHASAKALSNHRLLGATAAHELRRHLSIEVVQAPAGWLKADNEAMVLEEGTLTKRAGLSDEEPVLVDCQFDSACMVAPTRGIADEFPS